MPFGLSGSAVPQLNKILTTDSSLAESVAGLMSQVKSSGTMDNYSRLTAKFEQFESPDFSEKAILHFVIQSVKDKVSFVTIGHIMPVLTLLEKLSGRQLTSFTEMVDVFLTAAKRRAATVKSAVKKVGILPSNIISVLSHKYFMGEKSGDPVMLQTFVRSVVVYFTFCRFNCYSKLRAMDLGDNGNTITVRFPSAKNDQYHNGQEYCIVENWT